MTLSGQNYYADENQSWIMLPIYAQRNTIIIIQQKFSTIELKSKEQHNFSET